MPMNPPAPEPTKTEQAMTQASHAIQNHAPIIAVTLVLLLEAVVLGADLALLLTTLSALGVGYLFGTRR